jgi:hypothetical protein
MWTKRDSGLYAGEGGLTRDGKAVMTGNSLHGVGVQCVITLCSCQKTEGNNRGSPSTTKPERLASSRRKTHAAGAKRQVKRENKRRKDGEKEEGKYDNMDNMGNMEIDMSICHLKILQKNWQTQKNVIHIFHISQLSIMYIKELFIDVDNYVHLNQLSSLNIYRYDDRKK